MKKIGLIIIGLSVSMGTLSFAIASEKLTFHITVQNKAVGNQEVTLPVQFTNLHMVHENSQFVIPTGGQTTLSLFSTNKITDSSDRALSVYRVSSVIPIAYQLMLDDGQDNPPINCRFILQGIITNINGSNFGELNATPSTASPDLECDDIDYQWVKNGDSLYEYTLTISPSSSGYQKMEQSVKDNNASYDVW